MDATTMKYQKYVCLKTTYIMTTGLHSHLLPCTSWDQSKLTRPDRNWWIKRVETSHMVNLWRLQIKLFEDKGRKWKNPKKLKLGRRLFIYVYVCLHVWCVTIIIIITIKMKVRDQIWEEIKETQSEIMNKMGRNYLNTTLIYEII